MLVVLPVALALVSVLIGGTPLPFVLVFGFVGAFVLLLKVPVQSSLGYFALFVLGDANQEFDLIPDRRGAVREQ